MQCRNEASLFVAEGKIGKNVLPILSCVPSKRVTFYAWKICFMSVYDVKVSTPTANRCDTWSAWCPKTREITLSLPITWAGWGEKFVEVYILPIQQNRFLIYRRFYLGLHKSISIHGRCDDRPSELSVRAGSGSLCWSLLVNHLYCFRYWLIATRGHHNSGALASWG